MSAMWVEQTCYVFFAAGVDSGLKVPLHWRIDFPRSDSDLGFFSVLFQTVFSSMLFNI
jgi:hypothetical protein